LETIKKFKYRFSRTENAKEYRQQQVASARATFKRLCPKNGERSKCPSVYNGNVDKLLDEKYSLDENLRGVKQCKDKSSPEIDGIEYLVIQKLPEEVLAILLDICNDLLNKRHFPGDWQKFGIFFMPQSYGKNVRPISLAACLCRFLEKIINNRLAW
jgi:hypothetical protein